MKDTIPLFSGYPRLAGNLSRAALGTFPTPVEKLTRFGPEIGLEELYIKRDDQSGEEYGGNKVRKLEFLLGHALASGRKSVLTFGFAGSNHALATALYSRQLGLRCVSLLLPQPNALYVRKNLLLSYGAGAELHFCRNMPDLLMKAFSILFLKRLGEGCTPLVIPPGGSSSRGITGFVNAAFELREQIRAGKIPEPSRVYVAMGTMGTAAGLVLGFAAAGLRSRVIPVRVVDEKYADSKKLLHLVQKTNTFLVRHDPSFPRIPEAGKDVVISQGYFGRKYALFTGEGMVALSRLREQERIILEGTYTAKALAALVDDVQAEPAKNEVVLFWNTYNSRDASGKTAVEDYRRLPRGFHRYFEEEVQPLDRLYSS